MTTQYTISKGVKGEFYPCKPDIFELTHEPAESNPVELHQIAERKPLTDEQIIKQHMPQHGPVTYQSMLDFARAIERAHGIVHKNTQDLDTSEKRVQKTDEN